MSVFWCYSTKKHSPQLVADVDQAWHRINVDEVIDDVNNFEITALTNAGVPLELAPARIRSTYFSHIFSGVLQYSARFYAYLWSEVLEADAVEWFEENGGLTRANGDHFRKTVLTPGGGKDPMEMFREFRGRAPDIQFLLNRLG